MTRPCAWPGGGALHLATRFSRVKAWPTCRGAASFAISTSFSATLTMSISQARSVRTETRRSLWQSGAEPVELLDASLPVLVLQMQHHGALGVMRSLGRLGVPMYGVHPTRRPPAS